MAKKLSSLSLPSEQGEIERILVSSAIICVLSVDRHLYASVVIAFEAASFCEGNLSLLLLGYDKDAQTHTLQDTEKTLYS